jgi:hypothetical protein
MALRISPSDFPFEIFYLSLFNGYGGEDNQRVFRLKEAFRELYKILPRGSGEATAKAYIAGSGVKFSTNFLSKFNSTCLASAPKSNERKEIEVLSSHINILFAFHSFEIGILENEQLDLSSIKYKQNYLPKALEKYYVIAMESENGSYFNSLLRVEGKTVELDYFQRRTKTHNLQSIKTVKVRFSHGKVNETTSYVQIFFPHSTSGEQCIFCFKRGVYDWSDEIFGTFAGIKGDGGGTPVAALFFMQRVSSLEQGIDLIHIDCPDDKHRLLYGRKILGGNTPQTNRNINTDMRLSQMSGFYLSCRMSQDGRRVMLNYMDINNNGSFLIKSDEHGDVRGTVSLNGNTCTLLHFDTDQSHPATSIFHIGMNSVGEIAAFHGILSSINMNYEPYASKKIIIRLPEMNDQAFKLTKPTKVAIGDSAFGELDQKYKGALTFIAAQEQRYIKALAMPVLKEDFNETDFSFVQTTKP